MLVQLARRVPCRSARSVEKAPYIRAEVRAKPMPIGASPGAVVKSPGADVGALRPRCGQSRRRCEKSRRRCGNCASRGVGAVPVVRVTPSATDTPRAKRAGGCRSSRSRRSSSRRSALAWLGLAAPLRARRTIIRMLTTVIRTLRGSINKYILVALSVPEMVLSTSQVVLSAVPLLDHPLTFSIDSGAPPGLPTGACVRPCVRADRRAHDHPRSSTHA